MRKAVAVAGLMIVAGSCSRTEESPPVGDDHEPPIKTSAWKAGLTVGPYTRTRFVPLSTYNGPADIIVGLYMPGGDLVLSTTLTENPGGRWRWSA